MPRLDVPGASLYYESDGHISAPALLLIPAGVASLRMWDPLVAGLAADHFVIRVDPRGTGQTRTSDVTFSNRDDLRAVLGHLGVVRATVLGCSRGGSLALDLALESPERVAGLVTVGARPGGFPRVPVPDAERIAFQQLYRLFEEREWHELIRREVDYWTFGPRRRRADLDQRFVQLAYSLHRANSVHATERPNPTPLDPPAARRLTELNMHALVTVGEEAPTSTLAAHDYLSAAIPGARGHRFAGAAQLPSVEHPAQFERVLRDWLDENGL